MWVRYGATNSFYNSKSTSKMTRQGETYQTAIQPGGNPVLFIDPTGEDIHKFDAWGNFRGFIPLSGADVLILVNPDGTALSDKDGRYSYTILDEGSFNVLRTNLFFNNGKQRYNYDVYVVIGHSNAKTAFEFFSNNITGNKTIEYSMVRQGNVSYQNSINFIFTSHESHEEGGFAAFFPTLFKNHYIIQDFTHSHSASNQPSVDDYKAISDLRRSQSAFSSILPANYIYYVPSHQYIYYSVFDNHRNNTKK